MEIHELRITRKVLIVLGWVFACLLLPRILFAQLDKCTLDSREFFPLTENDALDYIEKARLLAYMENYDSALLLLMTAKSLTFDSAALSKCLRIESQIHLCLNNVKHSGVSARRALALLPVKFDVAEAVVIQNVLGSVEVFGGNFEQGFVHYHTSLKLLEKIHDESRKAVILSNLGVLFYKMFDYETAIEFWEQALELDIDKNDADNCRINLALAYVNLQNYEKSKCLIKGFSQRVNSMNRRLKVSLYYATGTYYDSIGKPDSSIVYFEKSYNIAKYSDVRHAAENLLSLARIYTQSSKISQAERFLDRAENIAKAQNFPDILLRCSSERVRLARMGDNLSSWVYAQDEYLKRRRLFYNVHMSRVAAAHQQIFREKDQARRLSIIHAHLQATIELADKQTRLQAVISIIAIMFCGLAVLLIYQIRMHIRNKTILEKAVKSRISKCERKNRMLLDVLHAGEMKRRRMEWRLNELSKAFDEYGKSFRSTECETGIS